ncbi:polymorphic toxin type 17 domain-containing protein [Salinivibrio sp. ML290]|uniref:polymorphic toxin type 17 domain-containing protein n=1 Tax=Salinivibrio sp. ML290 TaxID=1909468 RepID=UPI001F51835D|nr:polymorphic toxin type 17 domain-containing protein [Salinivibrio sp. ML290]
MTDHAGTPQELCNEQGDIVWRGEQALWGHYHGQSQRHWQRREEAANDSIQCDLRYQGQIEDPESSLYYNVNRYYDADSGQYLSPDPIGFAGGLRPQAYVANPLEWVDPLGLAGSCSKKITSVKGRLKKEQLPTKGKIRFVPPKGYNPSNPLPKGPQGGFIDRFGNEWVKGPSRTAGQDFEWDVQLSKTGRKKIGWVTRDGSHANVSLDGRITHK